MRYIQRELIVVDAVQWNGTLDHLKKIEKIFPEVKTIYIGLGDMGTIKRWRCYTKCGTYSVEPGTYIYRRGNDVEAAEKSVFEQMFTEYPL